MSCGAKSSPDGLRRERTRRSFIFRRYALYFSSKRPPPPGGLFSSGHEPCVAPGGLDGNRTHSSWYQPGCGYPYHHEPAYSCPEETKKTASHRLMILAVSFRVPRARAISPHRVGSISPHRFSSHKTYPHKRTEKPASHFTMILAGHFCDTRS
jgi:hypothetical protein